MKTKGWQEAIKKEIDSILNNHTWELVNRPTDKRVITAKWIFRTKKGPNGELIKLKARICARGFQQTEGVDFTEIFALVVRWSTIKTILALATKRKWKMKHIDVITAFLNGLITKDIHMEILEGFKGYGDPTKVVKLNKAFYGLKQAPKVWYERIDTWLTG
jgi:hypothetical protein